MTHLLPRPARPGPGIPSNKYMRFRQISAQGTPWRLGCCLALACTSAFGQTQTQTQTQIRIQIQPPSPKPDPARAEQAYLEGARAIDRKDYATAQTDFARAATLNPASHDYALALIMARQGHISTLIQQAATARLLNQPAQADTLLAEARILDPHNDLIQQHTDTAPPPRVRIDQPGRSAADLLFAPPIHLTPGAPTQEFHARGDVKDVVRQVALAYGIKVVFDDSVTPQALRFDLEQQPYEKTMQILLQMANLFAVPLDSKTLFVAKDTQENRSRLERQVEETFYVPGSTPEQMTELQNIVKNVFDVQKVNIQQNAYGLVIRAPEPTLKVVNYTLQDLVDGSAEVILELKLFTVDKTRTRNTGISTPSSVGAFSIASEAQSIVSANESIIQQAIAAGAFTPSGNAAQDIITEAIYLIASGLASDAKVSNLIGLVGGGLTSAGIYLGSATTINFALNSSDARALEDVTTRVTDRQTSTIRVGSKYPITTATYQSNISSATTSALAGVSVNGVSASSLLSQYLGSGSVATVPQVQFEDIGLTLKTTPTVLKSGLVRMSVDLKIESLTGASLDNIPILTSRAFTSDVSVADGVTAMVVSELSTTESAAISGIPGLAELPGFQESAADKLAEVGSSELVLLVTPHVVRKRSSLIAGPRIAFQTSAPRDF